MNILNKDKPKHMKPRRRWLTPLPALAVAVSMAFAPAAMADTGIDTASYQGCWDGAQAKSSGVNFAFIKLNQGTGYVNPYATCQVNAARAGGIREGAYDFASPQTSSPEAEADKFVAEARARGMVGRAIPVLDWEPSAPGGYWGKQTWWALRWVNRVKATWGVNPMIYMSAAMIPTGDWSAVVATNAGLWVAGYPRGYMGDRLRDPGSVPYSVSPWPFAAAWQYSSSGAVGGIGGAVDVNWFYGDAVTWAKYAGAPASSVTPNATTPPPNNKTNGAPVADANTLASAVIRGEYGNDPQRRQLLGSRYTEVMAIVNRRLGGSPGASAAANCGDVCVTVGVGDTLSSIAVRNGGSWDQYTGYRSGNPALIYPGETVCRRGGTATTPAYAGGGRYVVRAGDTLGGIAAYYGVNMYSIHGYRSGNPALIYPGETLYW